MAVAARDFTIGWLSRATGCKAQTIRFYEHIGLLPAPARSAGKQRIYRPADAQRLSFIRHCRYLGFPLPDIRELLSLADDPERSCAAIDGIARTHLAEIGRRIARLQRLGAELRRMIDDCSGERVAECRIIQALADPRHCPFDDHPFEQKPG